VRTEIASVSKGDADACPFHFATDRFGHKLQMLLPIIEVVNQLRATNASPMKSCATCTSGNSASFGGIYSQNTWRPLRQTNKCNSRKANTHPLRHVFAERAQPIVEEYQRELQWLGIVARVELG
jgi:hypothetical protein